MKAPEDEEDEDHLGSGWSEEDLKSTYHRKELQIEDPSRRGAPEPRSTATDYGRRGHQPDSVVTLCVSRGGWVRHFLRATATDVARTLWENRCKIRRSSPARSNRRDNGSAPTDQATVTESSDRSVGTLQKFFNAAMDRYLAEEREANKDPASTRPQHQGSQDVEMESIRSSDHGSRWEYDPDDVDFSTSDTSHRGR
ncbi:hypothetical protein PHMEG_00036895 [Phytophthora megakarya]|uniref:Uncharacterized protein n=1 Tax=Phytophthora megakarya TaxID=4795 RepID=A0A225UKT9_9STRA|nr:hypothetical protein PHMEG_00036895 [Phytophthora megakarya]